MRTLIQIVPRRARSPEGVGDHARKLAEEFERAHGLRTIFIACTPLPPEARADDGWETLTLARRDSAALGEALATARAGDPAAPVLLHVSSYGYQKRGVPLWLVQAMRRWRRDNPAPRLVGLFHELNASGPVWRSSFWLQHAQAWTTRALFHLCDAAAVVTTPYANRLHGWADPARPRPILLMPVFSNVGEPAAPPPASTRVPTLAVFGRGGSATILYGEAQELVAAFVRAAGLSAIVDIGERPIAPPTAIAGVPMRSLGEAPADAVRQALLGARFGLLYYNAQVMEKSGIFAAYCAHGVIPVCVGHWPFGGNGLEPGVNCLRLPLAPGEVPPADLDALQGAALRWYKPHSLIATATALADVLTEQTGAA